MPEAPKYCLVTLSSEEIVQKWEQLSPLIQCSLPPIFTNNAEIMSRFFNDGFSGSKNMVIVCLTALKDLSRPDIWSKGMDLLKHVAKTRGCLSILAYSNVRSIIELIKSIGGTAEFTLLKIGV